VFAVFAPGLGDDFKFDVGGFAVPLHEDFLHGEHVLAGERELHVVAQGFQSVAVELSNGDVLIKVSHLRSVRRNDVPAMNGWVANVFDKGVWVARLAEDVYAVSDGEGG